MRISASIIAFFYIGILAGCTSLSINVRDVTREEKPSHTAAAPPDIHRQAGQIISTRHEQVPTALDHLTHARLAYAHWQKIVIVETILKTPQDSAPKTDEPGNTRHDAEKFIKPYNINPWLDKRAMGMRSKASGTGFICGQDADGQKLFICTNAHVVEDGSEITVRMASGSEYRAVVLAKTEKPDAAVLMIESKEKISPLAWGDSDAVSIGESVMAIGHPRNFYYSVSHGIISSKRLIRAETGVATSKFLQVDMAINLGNSGSPLFNMRGEVIGVIWAIWPDSQGIAFAIPANEFRKIMEKIQSEPAHNAPQ